MIFKKKEPSFSSSIENFKEWKSKNTVSIADDNQGQQCQWERVPVGVEILDRVEEENTALNSTLLMSWIIILKDKECFLQTSHQSTHLHQHELL